MKNMLSKPEGGIAIALLWTMVFFIVIVSCVFMIEVYFTNVKAEVAKDAVTMAAYSVYRNIDVSQLASGSVVLDQAAVDTFKHYLAKNMKLNNDLTPKDGSIAAGPVEIDMFKVYDKNSTETLFPDGSKINYKPSLFVRIKFDVEPILKGILGNKNSVYTSSAVELIYNNN